MENDLNSYYRFGVFGSADGDLEHLNELAYQIGENIAIHNGVILTGGCSGLPYQAALGAKSKGGFSIGFSPFSNREEHEKNGFPIKPYFLVYTGLGKKGRNPVTCMNCDAAIFISGRSGTLNEFTIFYDDAKKGSIIGLLDGTGGVVDNEIKSFWKRVGSEKPTKAKIIYGHDPQKLIEIINRLLVF